MAASSCDLLGTDADGESAARLELLADGAKTVRQACEFLGVSRSWLYEQMEGGLLPWVKLGRRRVIPKRALVEFAAERLCGVRRDKAALQ